ncbi:hypothetical protein HXX76_013438 [Chlamydomonas incerta]|uniref:Uncharacterized protein n=1 Tax=Chlamydomonas incerta TaxID=51695 RepID=A0A835SEK6_CHLIN|nr:hypothetical protein HXX76_013438 [Chlamydomonas incerta]|eukprot:KAG2425813.1 hypothetical protein HXX76_013438 [Chlamydomonas incerta]
MIELAALKQQLQLLGHNLPDSQIVAILQDMNIDFADLDGSGAGKAGPTSAAAGPPKPRAASILDSFQPAPLGDDFEPDSSSAPVAERPQRYSYDYTDHTQGAALGNSVPAGVRAQAPRRPASSTTKPAFVGAASPTVSQPGDGDEDETYDADEVEASSDEVEDEPGLSCRHCQAGEHAGACAAATAAGTSGGAALSPGFSLCYGAGTTSTTLGGPADAASTRQAWAEGRGSGVGTSARGLGPSTVAAAGASSGAGIRGLGPAASGRQYGTSSELVDSLGRLNLLAAGGGPAGAVPAGAGRATGPATASTRGGGPAVSARPLSGVLPRPSSAPRGRDQQSKPAGRPGSGPQKTDLLSTFGRYPKRAFAGHDDDDDDDQSDTALAADTNDPMGLGRSMHHLAWPQGGRASAAPGRGGSAAGAPRASASAAPGGTGRPGPAAARGAPGQGQGQRAGVARDPYAYDDEWRGVARGPDLDVPGRSLSPQASHRSFMSRASSASRATTRAGGPGGAAKVDRVKRYQQLAAEWGSNSFLNKAGGASKGTSRKPVNFHSHFASLHAAEEAERQRVLKDARAKTKKELGGAQDAPTANRRDELRWQMRQRLMNQY